MKNVSYPDWKRHFYLFDIDKGMDSYINIDMENVFYWDSCLTYLDGVSSVSGL